MQDPFELAARSLGLDYSDPAVRRVIEGDARAEAGRDLFDRRPTGGMQLRADKPPTSWLGSELPAATEPVATMHDWLGSQLTD